MEWLAVKSKAKLAANGSFDIATIPLGIVIADNHADASRRAFELFGRNYSGLAVIARRGKDGYQ